MKPNRALGALSAILGPDFLDNLLPPRKKREEKIITQGDLDRKAKAEEKRQRKAEKRAGAKKDAPSLLVGDKVSASDTFGQLRRGTIHKVEGDTVTIMMETEEGSREWPFLETHRRNIGPYR